MGLFDKCSVCGYMRNEHFNYVSGKPYSHSFSSVGVK